MHFAFSVPAGSLPALAERLSRRGAEVETTEHEGGDRSIYVKDPEGNVVEFWDYYDRR